MPRRTRPKPLTATKEAKLRARTQVGPPKPTAVVESRKRKPLKHKKREETVNSEW